MTPRKKRNRTPDGGRQQAHATNPQGEAPSDKLAARPSDRLFESLRSGAANVAGVSYQIGLTAWTLVAGARGAEPGLDVASVTPEGYEDIDCTLGSGERLLIQAKDRGPGGRAIAMAEVARIITHAAEALGNDGRFAIATNGSFGSSLPTTGFAVTLENQLAATGDDSVRKDLVESLNQELDAVDVQGSTAESLISRTHLVTTGSDLAQEILVAVQDSVGIQPALASLVRAELLRDLSQVAAMQRESSSSATAVHRTFSDVELLATRIRQDVDLPSLEEAILAGVCEPADYLSTPRGDRSEFFAGVDVIPAHIAAGFDVIRPVETTAVLQGLEERGDVLIAGPSGSGKSALLWRSARLVDLGARIIRVLRVADDSDVELLVRHVRRAKPEPGMRVLVVADDLGRDSMSAWPLVRRRLGEIAGVLVLSAVRREHLTPLRAGDAVVVDPVLTESSAECIYDALVELGVPTKATREEAVEQAHGLLMEFIAIATTGRRLRAILADQVATLGGPTNRVPREALRLICGAHLLGHAIAADTLPAALETDPGTAGDAMTRLLGEHLVVSEGSFWHGLHDLRVEVLFELLHATPPPSIGATYARVLEVLPLPVGGRAARRAAVRISRAIMNATPGLTPSDRLDSLHSALKPLACALHDAVARIARGESGYAAMHAASLLEAADRLDTVAYAYSVLPFLDKERPPTLPLRTLAELAYSSRVDGLDLSGLAPWFASLANRLPDRHATCAQTVAGALTPMHIQEIATQLPLIEAVRFLESVEFLGRLTSSNVREIFEHHAGPDNAVPKTRLDGDLRAQLTASLIALAQLRGREVADATASVEARAATAVACDSWGASVELSFEPLSAPDPSVEDAVRDWTYSADQMLVARAIAFARPSEEPPPRSAYWLTPGTDATSLNEQAVGLARRLFDACPEVDRVDVEIWQASCMPTAPTREDVKSLRAGVLRRRSQVARNVAFQAAVAEAVEAENWTHRLREQAQLAQELIRLLMELPDRLRRPDNARRRRDWTERAVATSVAVASLPGRPPERLAVQLHASTQDWSDSAALADEELRGKDHAKAAFESLTGTIVQVSESLDNDNNVCLAGGRFASAPEELHKARLDGAPVFAGLDTLPQELDDLSGLVGRLLTALQTPQVRRLLSGPRPDRATIDQALEEAAKSASGEEGEQALALLRASGVDASLVLVADHDPIAAWRTRRAVLLVDVARWEAAAAAIFDWDSESREDSGITGRVVAVAIDRGEVLPMGFVVLSSHEWIFPLLEEGIEVLARDLDMPARGREVRSEIQAAADRLAEFSYERVREANRTDSWWRVPASSVPPSEIASSLREAFGSEVLDSDDDAVLSDGDRYKGQSATIMLDLCDLVAAETGEPDGFAAQLASIDVTNLAAATPGPLALRFLDAIELAVEADAAPD